MVKRPFIDPEQLSADAAVGDGFSLAQGELFDNSFPTFEVGYIATAELKPTREVPDEARTLIAAFRARHPGTVSKISQLDQVLDHMRERYEA